MILEHSAAGLSHHWVMVHHVGTILQNPAFSRSCCKHLGNKNSKGCWKSLMHHEMARRAEQPGKLQSITRELWETKNTRSNWGPSCGTHLCVILWAWKKAHSWPDRKRSNRLPMFIFSLPLVKNLAERDWLPQQARIWVIADTSWILLNHFLLLDPWLPVNPRHWEMLAVGILCKHPQATAVLPGSL